MVECKPEIDYKDYFDQSEDLSSGDEFKNDYSSSDSSDISFKYEKQDPAERILPPEKKKNTCEPLNPINEIPLNENLHSLSVLTKNLESSVVHRHRYEPFSSSDLYSRDISELYFLSASVTHKTLEPPSILVREIKESAKTVKRRYSSRKSYWPVRPGAINWCASEYDEIPKENELVVPVENFLFSHNESNVLNKKTTFCLNENVASKTSFHEHKVELNTHLLKMAMKISQEFNPQRDLDNHNETIAFEGVTKIQDLLIGCQKLLPTETQLYEMEKTRGKSRTGKVNLEMFLKNAKNAGFSSGTLRNVTQRLKSLGLFDLTKAPEFPEKSEA